MFLESDKWEKKISNYMLYVPRVRMNAFIEYILDAESNALYVKMARTLEIYE